MNMKRKISINRFFKIRARPIFKLIKWLFQQAVTESLVSSLICFKFGDYDNKFPRYSSLWY